MIVDRAIATFEKAEAEALAVVDSQEKMAIGRRPTNRAAATIKIVIPIEICNIMGVPGGRGIILQFGVHRTKDVLRWRTTLD